jgi:acyl-CoA dehydrogenase family protein 9
MAKSDSDKSVSFMRSLCMGQIEEDVLLPFPTMSDDEKEMLRGVSDALSTMLGAHAHDFRKWDREGHFPESFIDELKEFGAFGLIIPEEHGGLGLRQRGLRAGAVARPGQARQLVHGGDHRCAFSSIGMKRHLAQFGNDEQKARYLPRLASGEMIAAFCLTESGRRL